MNPITSFQIAGRTVNLFGCTYRVGSAQGFVLTTDQGEPFGSVSVNLPGYPLGPDEVMVKTWGENAQARAPLLECGVFIDTGKRVQCGFAEAEVWRLLPTKH